MNTSNHTIIRRLLPGLILGFVVLIGLALLGDLREVSQSLLSFRWEYLFNRPGIDTAQLHAALF